MKKLISLLFILMLLLGLTPGSFAAAGDVTIYVAGDSTAQTYESNRAPLTGWAQKLPDYMPNGIKVANYAISGRSSKSFVNENRLSQILSLIKEGDYFLIQFGHNDQSNNAELATDIDAYQTYLKQYISGAKNKKATPVLISPIERRRFDKNGKAIATLADRAQAMKELAEAEGIPYVDIEEVTLKWWNYLGVEKTKEIFLHLDAGAYPNYPLGIADDTHLCENGAKLVAQLVASKLGDCDIAIADQLKSIVSPVPAEATEAEEADKKNDPEKPDVGQTDETEKYDAVLPDSKQYRDAAKEAQNFGLMTGYDDGTLGELDPVSRAQAAVLLSRMLKLRQNGPTKCSDVPAEHWASGSIAALQNAGILSAEVECFYPEAAVSFPQLSKMLVEALGYGERAKAIGEYPWGYLTEAAELGITKEVDLCVNDTVNRGITAKMLLNSLYVPLSTGGYLADGLLSGVYYVSEDGSDENDGSYKNPWLTLEKAAAAIKDGDTILVNSGTYEETQSAAVAANNVQIRCSDTGGAKIKYPQGKGIMIEGSNVTLSGLSLSEEGAEQTESNLMTGVITVKGANAAICENNISGGGILLQGAENTKIYNNIIRDSKPEQAAAVTITRGTTGCSVWNNSVISQSNGAIAAAVSMEEATDCRVLNNTVTGTDNGVCFGVGNEKVTLRNNIFTDCRGDAYVFAEQPERFDSNYNMFSNTYPKSWEKNSCFAEPLFDDAYEDWRLTAKSPAVHAGENLSGYALDFTDRYGVKPSAQWCMGAYQKLSDKVLEPQKSGGKLMYSENFASELKDWRGAVGSWTVKNGKLVQTTVAGRTLASYTGGYEWENYYYTGDVVSPMLAEGNCTGIVFRADKSMDNFYTFRYYEDSQLEFAVWRNGVFESLDKWAYQSESETLYNMGVKAIGSSFTFYINGNEVRHCTDDSHATGSIGFYAYRQNAEFDNARVESIK